MTLQELFEQQELKQQFINIKDGSKLHPEYISNILNERFTNSKGKSWTLNYKSVAHAFYTKRELEKGDTNTADAVFSKGNVSILEEEKNTTDVVDSWNKKCVEELKNTLHHLYNISDKMTKELIDTYPNILQFDSDIEVWNKHYPEILMDIRDKAYIKTL